ncbi:catalase [Bacillus subtilis]|nr:catalase [Bacillus subtilis]
MNVPALVENIVNAMKPVEKEEIKLRQIEATSTKRIPEYGKRVAEGLGLPIQKDS